MRVALQHVKKTSRHVVDIERSGVFSNEDALEAAPWTADPVTEEWDDVVCVMSMAEATLVQQVLHALDQGFTPKVSAIMSRGMARDLAKVLPVGAVPDPAEVQWTGSEPGKLPSHAWRHSRADSADADRQYLGQVPYYEA